MKYKTNITTKDKFVSANTDDRKRNLNEILLRIIRQSKPYLKQSK